MKKLMTMMALIMIMSLVLAACGSAIKDDTMPAAGDVMEKTNDTKDTMMDDTKEMMEETETMAPEDDTMDKSDDKDTSQGMMNEGEAAPAFTLMGVDGMSYSLSDFEGEKVYVKFWASWCSICLAGLDEVDQLAGSTSDYKVITVVTPDYKGEKSAEEFKMWFDGLDTKNMIVLLDQDGMVAKEYGLRAYPTSAYIGSDGVLIKVLPGHVNSELIDESFDKIN